MKQEWSSHWNKSKKPAKQRKYVYNAPLHLLRKIMSSHLSKELMLKYKKRSFPVRKGDIVKIMRGQFKGRTGKVNEVNRMSLRVYVEGANLVKRDGTKLPYPIHSSNLIITELNIDDKLRKKALERK